ncbi:MAG: hypothetical protein AAFR46_02085 [Pseudomonadota bacterium]
MSRRHFAIPLAPSLALLGALVATPAPGRAEPAPDPAAPAECAPMPDRGEERAALLAGLADAKSVAEGQRATGLVWQFWMTAPDATAQALLDAGMRAIRQSDFARAEAVLDDLVRYCPAFAEGWNQRAFARFLRGRYFESLADIERVLSREPAHFGALSGKLRILLLQGREPAARGVLREAARSYPWMVERGLLPRPDPGPDNTAPSDPDGVQGEDI